MTDLFSISNLDTPLVREPGRSMHCEIVAIGNAIEIEYRYFQSEP